MLGKLRETELSLSEWRQKGIQLEEVNKQLIGKFKGYEHSANLLKLNEKKVKEQFEEYEKMVKRVREENESLKRNYVRVGESKEQCENQLRER